MKIVPLKDFRALPSGTIFCKYDPIVFGDLCIKGETWETDFISASLTNWIECDSSSDLTDKLEKYQETKESFKLDLECYGRDGYFDDNQLFAIYEKDDLSQLIDVLKKSLIVTTQ